jgi:hypothetical protein
MRVEREADIIAMADAGRLVRLNRRSWQAAPFPIFVPRFRDLAAPRQQADAPQPLPASGKPLGDII